MNRTNKTVNMDAETWADVDKELPRSDCRNRSHFIERAVKSYLAVQRTSCRFGKRLAASRERLNEELRKESSRAE